MTHPIAQDSPEAASADVPERITPRKLLLLWIALAFSSLFIAAALTTPTIITLQMKLMEVDPIGAVAIVGTLVAVGMLSAALVSPLAGKLSDRTRSRFGMRRPWVIAGVLIGLVGTAGVAVTTDVAVIFVFWGIASLGYGMASTLPLAILTEQTPERHRGLMGFGMSAAYGIAAALGAAIIPLFPESTLWPFLLPAIAAAVLVPLLMLITPDNRLTGPRPPLRFSEVLGAYWVNPMGRPGFTSLMVVMFLNGAGFVIFSTYLYFILIFHNGVSEADAPAVMTGIAGIGGIVSIVAGAVTAVISDRLGHRRVFLIVATIVLAGGMLMQAFIESVPMILFTGALQYGAYGVIGVFAFAILAEVSGSETAGRDAGMYNTVTMMSAVLGPIAASLLIASDPLNMMPVIYLSVAVTLVGAIWMLFTKHIK